MNPTSQFLRCLPVTLREEGGYSNDAGDPGGKTQWGITHGTYDAWRKRNSLPPRDVREITPDEMRLIYRAEYYDSIGADDLSPGPALSAFDVSVNSGPGKARQFLNKVAYLPDAIARVHRIAAMRLSFLHALGTWSRFGKGWGARVGRIEATSVKWELAQRVISPPMASGILIAEGNKAKAKSATLAKASAVPAAASAGTVLTNSPGGMSPWIIVAIIVAGVAVAGLVYLASRRQSARGDAFLAVAKEV